MTHSIGQPGIPCGDHSTDTHYILDRETFADALEQCVEDASGKHISVAMEAGIDDSTLSKWINSRKNPMPAWRLISWTKAHGPALLRWVAAQCGYELTKKASPGRLAS